LGNYSALGSLQHGRARARIGLIGPLEAIELFAGAGGLSLGLEAAGFVSAAAVELVPDACATYRSKHPEAKVFEADISTIDFRAMRGCFALVAGGPPCQPFSIGGKRLAADDPRNGIPQFLRALKELSPHAFIMENVAGMAAGGQSYLLSVVGQMERLGYSTTWQVLEAADYGVPQKRRRLFVVGTTTAKQFSFPVPTHGLAGRRPHRPAGSVVGHEAPPGRPNTAIVTYALNPSLRPSAYHGHLYNGGGRPIELTRPAPTMLASMGGNKTPWVDTLGIVTEYHAHLVAGGYPRHGLVPGARRITVEEAALLQSFPAGTAFAGHRSSQYRQVGNAVPPVLAEQVGLALRRHLFS
jgi:DNA (cytosine-5)-methyltransferase 1